MLDEFEAVIAEQWDLIDKHDQARFCYKFNRKDSDVRCVSYIYNIAIQAGKILVFYSLSLLPSIKTRLSLTFNLFSSQGD
jgi:hypothetical protein